MISAFEKLEKYRKLRQRMVVLPILGVEVITSPLTVGDDLALRTMMVSPELYDMEITKLIYAHTEFPKLDRKPTLIEFLERLSAYDRQYALWGIFTSTYETFGIQEIKCPKCQETWKCEIKIEELIQPDFVNKVWKKDESFVNYIYPITIDINSEEITKFVFNTCIPTIKKRLDILKLINSEVLKNNIDRYGSIFSRADDIALITKSIEIHCPGSETPDILEKFNDISRAITVYMSEQISKDVVDNYNKEHSKYVPEFKKPFGCNTCSHEFDYHVNMEVSLFQKYFQFS
jgi:hypothetical protein